MPTIHLSNSTLLVVGVVALLGLIVGFLVMAQFVALYTQCTLSGCPIGFMHLVGMRIRRVAVREVAFGMIRAHKAGLDLGPDPAHTLEVHALAGGHIEDTVSALITFKGAAIPATWIGVSSADLAGRDVLHAAEAAVRAKATGASVSMERALSSARLR